MAELELVTLHEDAERLVLRDPAGVEHTLAISEALRAAVRRDRPRTEALQAASEATLRPREVQARLRAGATAEDLAAESGLPLEHVRRYEWPVVAERAHVIDRVREHRVDSDGEATLGELADARLGARGVDPAEAEWTASRRGGAPWQVSVRFLAGGRERDAGWTFDPKGKVVTALDDEARWLSQPDDPVSPEILGVPARLDSAPAPRAPDAAGDATALLLDDLAGRRGQRPRGRAGERGPQRDELPLDLDRPSSGTGTAETTSPQGGADRSDDGASVVDLGARRHAQRTAQPDGAESAPAPEESAGTEGSADRPPAPGAGHPAGTAVEPETGADRAATSEPSVRTDGQQPPQRSTTSAADAPEEGAEPSSAPAPANASGTTSGSGAAGRRASRKGRAPMPSWDEIVFGGARPSS